MSIAKGSKGKKDTQRQLCSWLEGETDRRTDREPLASPPGGPSNVGGRALPETEEEEEEELCTVTKSLPTRCRFRHIAPGPPVSPSPARERGRPLHFPLLRPAQFPFERQLFCARHSSSLGRALWWERAKGSGLGWWWWWRRRERGAREQPGGGVETGGRAGIVQPW